MQLCSYAAMSVWTYESLLYAGIQACSMQLFKYAGMQVSKYASMEVCKYAKMQIYKYANLQIFKYASMNVCNYVHMLLCSAFMHLCNAYIVGSLFSSDCLITPQLSATMGWVTDRGSDTSPLPQLSLAVPYYMIMMQK